ARSRAARANDDVQGFGDRRVVGRPVRAVAQRAVVAADAHDADALDSASGLWGVLLCHDLRFDVGGDLGLAAVRRSALGSARRGEGCDSRRVLWIMGVD